MYEKGDIVIVQGMPAEIVGTAEINGQNLYEVLVQVPQVRWVPESQINAPSPGVPQPGVARPTPAPTPAPTPENPPAPAPAPAPARPSKPH